jgi:hypothetical protein
VHERFERKIYDLSETVRVDSHTHSRNLICALTLRVSAGVYDKCFVSFRQHVHRYHSKMCSAVGNK